MAVKDGMQFVIEAQGHCPSLIEQIEQRILEPTPTEVDTAISIIQKHLQKEARNRQLEMIEPEDLCPAQKRDMVRDLSRIFRS